MVQNENANVASIAFTSTRRIGTLVVDRMDIERKSHLWAMT